MRNILPLLFVLLLPGCFWSSTSSVTPVTVDAAAAYPEQTSDTKPPVLTGYLPLSKEELDRGSFRLFDGVSKYGWEVLEGNIQISAGKSDNENVLVFHRRTKEKVVIAHSFFNECFRSIENGPNNEKITSGFGHPALNYSSGGGKSNNTYTFCPGFATPRDMQPLTEVDWKGVAGESEAAWVDGVLELSGGPGMLETVKEYGDFILQLEYFTEPGGNSGVFFRCIPGEILNGYECQIFNNPPDEDYKKYIGTDTGGIFRRCVGRNLGPKDGEWNYLTIAARGNKVATWVNGIQAVDWADTREEHENPRNGLRFKPGTIQLQGHDPGTKIKFRNFRISEIGE